MAQNGSVRSSPFMRQSGQSQTPNNDRSLRPQSAIVASNTLNMTAHNRNQSNSSLNTPALTNGHSRTNSDTSKNGVKRNSTFAPSFIKSEEIAHRREAVSSIEGENDFSGKRYVWIKDPAAAFVKGWVVEELEGGMLLVQCDDGNVRTSSKYESRTRLTQAIATRGRRRIRRQSQSRQIRQSRRHGRAHPSK